jgi:hypothetical protein
MLSQHFRIRSGRSDRRGITANVGELRVILMLVLR